MDTMKTLHDIGENGLLRELLPRLPQRPPTVVGPGDDCAVIRLPGSTQDWLLTTDPVIEHRHFRTDTPPRLVGRKAVARAISDIAAMGGAPRWILINLVAPARAPLARIRRIYGGIIAAARRWKLGILGGDTAEGPVIELHITGIGQIPRGKAICRSGAQPGDWVYVTGSLGGAWREGCRHHLLFEPRLKEGQFLARHKWATAMMDLSDGLAADLPRLLDASGRGVELHAAAIPLSRSARRSPQPLERALGDGEDFELLFTVPATKRSRFETAWRKNFPRLPATCIGRILADSSRRILRLPNGQEQPLQTGGYQHFLFTPEKK